MKRVLFVGREPDAVDFSDPALPPGLSAEKIRAGIDAGMKQMAARGWHADLCLFRSEESATDMVERMLAAAAYDCVVIGGGVRVPPRNLVLFEKLVNAVHKAAPHAFIAFNTSPEDTGAAAARWVEHG